MSRPPLRHCPICGIAMQAHKSRVDIDDFDHFECLNCRTTIVQAAEPGEESTNDES